MKHISEGILRAYFDEALSEAEQKRVIAHLATCSRCAEKAASIEARNARVRASMAGLSSPYLRAPMEAQVARERLRDYVYEKKENTMLKKAFSRRYRPAWVAVAFVLFFAVAFSFQPVRALAGDFLALFRVQKIEFVEADIEGFDDEESFREVADTLGSFVEKEVVVKSGGETQYVDDMATVRSLVDYPLRFPKIEGETHYAVEPGGSASMQVDIQKMRLLLAELGYTAFSLPESLDGADVDITFGTSVVVSYGGCPLHIEEGESVEESDDKRSCTVFMQIPSPNITAPAELDIDQLGQAYLQLLGMTPDEAATFSQRVDWTTTMVVPIPNFMHMDYREVQVNGVDGTIIIYPPSYHSDQDEYMLTWAKDDIIYSLSGVGDTATALEIAASIE